MDSRVFKQQVKASELKIGNWIDYSGDGYQISAIGKDKVGIESDGPWGGQVGIVAKYDEIAPLPLTPEILEKAGFKKDGQGHWRKLMPKQKFFIFYQAKTLYDDRIPPNGEFAVFITHQGKSIPIDTVHELQNAYFMLTRHELKIPLMFHV